MLLLIILSAVALSGPIRVIDGDTLVAGTERIRLTAIDAPEIHACPKYRHCAPGDPFTSKAALTADLAQGNITIDRLSTDHYGRTVGDLYVNGESVSCMQLAAGQAIYWAKYDRGGRIKRECQL